MIRAALIAAASFTALAGIAVAQPMGRGHGPEAGFGLLALDANADGKVERAEVVAAQRSRFAALDGNKDGQITPEEMKTFHEQAREARTKEMAAKRFDALDADGNGQISEAEFSAGMKPGRAEAGGGHGPARELRVRGPGGGFERQDGPRGQRGAPGARGGADGQANVSFEDFSSRALEAFDRADTNKDGSVTIKELQASRPNRR